MIHTPQTVSELLVTRRKNPGARLFSGGTWILGNQTDKYPLLSKEVIYLGQVEELKKITRSERFLEFGSCATLADILKLKARIIPPLLHDAIQIVGTPQVRNLATIGGNLAIAPRRMSLFPALMVLDARIELRRQGGARWVEIRRFINDENRPDIDEDEVLTRIRIPIEEWEFQRFQAIGDRMQQQKEYSVCAMVARISKNTVMEARALFINNRRTQFRPFQTEGNLISKKLPLMEKEQSDLMEIFSREMKNHVPEGNSLQQRRFERIFHWLLTELSDR